MRLVATVALAVLLCTAGCTPAPAVRPPEAPRSEQAMPDLRASLERLVAACGAGTCGVSMSTQTRLDTVIVDDGARRVEARFSPPIAYAPWAPDAVARFETLVAEAVTAAKPGYAATVTVDRGASTPVALADLVRQPRRPGPDGAPRATPPPTDGPPLVRRLDGAATPTQGLAGRHVAIWPSHGWYYETKLDRWEWQRARLFTTVEDLHPFSFVTGELTPMLERAGAVVLLSRERDTNSNEAVTDRDGSTGRGRYTEHGRWRDGGDGFRHAPPYGDQQNPFRLGTSRASAGPDAQAEWSLDVPEAGTYSLSVSYGRDGDRQNADASLDARYTVTHAGGTTEFAVNQTMGGGMWVPVGTFTFAAGPGAARVSLRSGDGRPVSADAVRIGGGMGNITRGGRTSGRPRYVEAARYFMQYAGFPDSTVYNVTRVEDDYKDDYRGRGEWINELRGAPFGPTDHRDAPGFRVPVELSFGFHTDAGVTTDGSTVGTLAIYRSVGQDGGDRFPDGVSRLANRDLTERVQTQIVDDIRAGLDPDWNRRALWDRDYNEVQRPNVPSILLELLSHQNFADMRVALDPRYRFTVSRAIYKAVGRFLTDQRGEPFVVLPLAPTHVSATLDQGRIRLHWQPVSDPLEPTAEPTGFVVYTRDERPGQTAGWDNGRAATGTEARLEAPPPGVVRSYRVAATNAGGESEPGTAVAVGLSGRGDRPVLVIDGFDRVSAPAVVDAVSPEGHPLQGFDLDADPGVPKGLDPATVGKQYDFDATHAWSDDDAPGWGSSAADLETRPILGNTFDWAAAHGRSLLAAGRSFVSATDETVEDGSVPLADYPVVDLVLGLEKRTPWPTGGRPDDFEALPGAMRRALAAYLGGGGKLLLSGSYWATDTAVRTDAAGRTDSTGVVFLRDVLGVKWRTDRAAVTGRVMGPRGGLLEPFSEVTLRTRLGVEGYTVRNPDAIEPADASGATVLRFAENSTSAAVARRTPSGGGVVAFGFPLEALEQAADRDRLVGAALRRLEE